ncbi:hypothetical protein OJAV_G00003410 [Oryzias javanicus]|uniref:Ig-like domain-containing protein n=1 Tax=Oryzias javanicus TaxID=123683 RepID=A0A437DN28_ORYJA|nr:hypothetical protein OJAV_G00003410 [Oryzias javanicus]
MWACGGPITLVLFRLFGSASLFPYTPAPSVPSEISPPPPLLTNFPSLLSSSLSIPSSNPHLTSSSGEPSKRAGCDLSISPSSLVVRFGDPVKANCSKQKAGFPILGWAVPVVEHCHMALSLTVYQPPTAVSITFVNHTGPLLEGGSYSLQCTVQDVAPLEKVVDNGTEYWCEARLDLGPEGPQQPLVVTSQKLTLLVLSHPNSTKHHKIFGNCNVKTSQSESSGTTNSYQTCFLLAALLAQMIIQK